MSESDSTSRAEGLLEQIADTALDDDYYVVRSGPQHTREFNTVLTGLALGVFALLVSIAAIQTRSDRPASERERETLISDVAARKSCWSAGRRSPKTCASRLRTCRPRSTGSIRRTKAAPRRLRPAGIRSRYHRDGHPQLLA
ncbi:hypothetical protein [Aeromicrobium sp. UC242_57]|uniref:hypothetical protein n=1 Tax=Aeromicrobium sp. UC242_57 TaxID=3374624 RepID=UPI0037AD8CCB